MTKNKQEQPDRLYIESTGTNCYIDGVPSVVTAVVRDLGLHRRARAAFVQVDPGPMLYVELGSVHGDRDQWAEVVSSRTVDRDEFDRLNELDTLRRDLGWREPVAVSES